MPLYKFYRIVPTDATQTDCYIGHTTQPLYKRFSQHRSSSNPTTSKSLIERYGKDNLRIVLIHELELPSKDYAVREERRLIEMMRRYVVNTQMPWVGATDEEEEALLAEVRFEEKRKLRKELAELENNHRQRGLLGDSKKEP